VTYNVHTPRRFANWPTTHELTNIPGLRKLYRDVGTSPFGGLYKPSDLTETLATETYDRLTACVDPTFEMGHGVVHMFVGGFMADSRRILIFIFVYLTR
jgi:hypothetical protein